MCGGNCTCRKYKVYKVDGECCYSGYSLVAAENAEEATKYIKRYKENEHKILDFIDEYIDLIEFV